jgi:hypothetical protein
MKRTLFIALLVMVAAGCKKEAGLEQEFCFSCEIQRTPESEDGMAGETKIKTQEHCGVTQAGIDQTIQSGTGIRQENGLHGPIRVKYVTKCRRK